MKVYINGASGRRVDRLTTKTFSADRRWPGRRTWLIDEQKHERGDLLPSRIRSRLGRDRGLLFRVDSGLLRKRNRHAAGTGRPSRYRTRAGKASSGASTPR